jgi:hypothetical protein
MATAKIIDLRNLLADRFPHPPPLAPSILATGLAFFDRKLSGGLPKSAITELIAPEISSGSASLIHALLQTAQRDGYFVTLIDGADSFDPCSLGNFSLRHLLWVRCHTAFQAIKAADLLLRDGNFSLVMVDLVLNSLHELGKIPQSSWYRLQRLVEAIPTVCLILTRVTIVPSAQVKVVLENAWSLRNLEQENALSQLRFRIERSHRKSEIGHHRSKLRGRLSH